MRKRFMVAFGVAAYSLLLKHAVNNNIETVDLMNQRSADYYFDKHGENHDGELSYINRFNSSLFYSILDLQGDRYAPQKDAARFYWKHDFVTSTCPNTDSIKVILNGDGVNIIQVPYTDKGQTLDGLSYDVSQFLVSVSRMYDHYSHYETLTFTQGHDGTPHVDVLYETQPPMLLTAE